MDSEPAYAALSDQLRRIAALEQVLGLLSWDQETQMPCKGAAQRAEHRGAVAAASHALAADSQMKHWLGAVDPGALGPAEAVNVREAARIHRRAARLPQALAADLARKTAEGQAAWAAARETNSFSDFAPSLEAILTLKRAEADCLIEAGQSRYDALLVEYEPETSANEIAAVFDRLRPGLTDARARIADAGRPAARLEGRFDHAGQMALARRLGDVFGYDWDAGRIDLAVHPSSSGSGGDVRITTRVDETDPGGCIYSTIHEVGHAVYEQGLDPALAFLPAGSHASMGIHESQSRLFENQLGRSRAFCEWLWPALRDQFGDAGAASPQALYEAVNAVESGFIRTEADEVHYNLHVMMRFDLERALISGDLEVAGLEVAWNERFLADFGREVPDARRGVLQDVHWSVGLFGYFPTYCLGNIYAAEIHNALRAALPGLDGLLADGNLQPVVAWLRKNIHRKGRLLAPRDLVAQACGQDPGEAALLEYLEDKFRGLYGV